MPAKGKAGFLNFFRDCVVLFKSLVKMIQVGVIEVLDCKVIDYEGKHERAPFVSPEARGGGCFIVVKFGKAVL